MYKVSYVEKSFDEKGIAHYFLREYDDKDTIINERELVRVSKSTPNPGRLAFNLTPYKGEAPNYTCSVWCEDTLLDNPEIPYIKMYGEDKTYPQDIAGRVNTRSTSGSSTSSKSSGSSKGSKVSPEVAKVMEMAEKASQFVIIMSMTDEEYAESVSENFFSYLSDETIAKIKEEYRDEFLKSASEEKVNKLAELSAVVKEYYKK